MSSFSTAKSTSIPTPTPTQTSVKTAAAAATPAPTSTSTPITPNPESRLPEAATLAQAAKLAIIEDKPIMMDYWMGSMEQSVRIGIRENGEKLLVRSEDEYTSPIAKIYSSASKLEYLIVTENSIYLVDAKIKAVRIKGNLGGTAPTA